MTTQALSRNIVNTRYANLSPETIDATKRSILDTLGVMLPPTTLVKTCESVYELMKEAGGKKESTLVGFGGKAPCWIAAFVNGSLCHAIDFDDCVGLEKPLMHPTGSSLPSALAISEKKVGVSGKEFITAVALGNDLSVRLASCPNKNVVFDYPFFPITTFGVFSATAVSGKLLGLAEGEMINALGLALNRVSGVTKGLFGSDFRAIRDGFNNREGVLCALLASKGMDSCKNAIELLFSTFYQGDIDPKYLTEDLGKKFRGSEVGFKPWPSCQGSHSYIQAILGIVSKNNLQPDQIEEVVLQGNKEGEYLFTPVEVKRKPTTSIAAKVSLPFVVAVALVHKNVSIANFLPENLADPEVLEMAWKVRFKLDNSLGSYSSKAELRTKEGKIFRESVKTLRGSLDNPLSDEELVAKFRDCAGYSKKRYSKANINRLIENTLHLEEVADIRDYVSLLA